ncbi:hypothetical protein [Stagnihabitans tardus]|uniref:DUF5666 domain-containing protein n=1 Tax=Stagnihabitans tardus TaxID=2699202 RepID=A0AAE4YED4_9RHOB|nr:hypothetical protein [Stagnihabitans tardus]NBZ88140.1 hypothetical protein [Stagnihabitans tardus]
MIRKSILFVALASTLAAGTAFAGTQVSGTVAKVDAAQGYVWLDNGVKYDVGTDFAHGVLPGNGVSLVVVQNGTGFDVVSAQPAGL